jgi:beta-glucosidase-like glycosyl hydrolase
MMRNMNACLYHVSKTSSIHVVSVTKWWSAEVPARALREIYLRPFELACRDAESPPWAVMTAYNRVNGQRTFSVVQYMTFM